MTEQEILYNAYNDSGVQTNEEVMALLGWSNDKVRNIKAKLKIRGFIDYAFGSPVKILKPYREVVDAPETLKAQIYIAKCLRFTWKTSERKIRSKIDF